MMARSAGGHPRRAGVEQVVTAGGGGPEVGSGRPEGWELELHIPRPGEVFLGGSLGVSQVFGRFKTCSLGGSEARR